MSATEAGKDSRDAAYDRIGKVLGVLRMQHRLSWRAVLDLTRELDQWQVYASAREAPPLLFLPRPLPQPLLADFRVRCADAGCNHHG